MGVIFNTHSRCYYCYCFV